MTDLNDYEMFVDGKTAEPSKDIKVLIARLEELHLTADAMGLRLPQLITAANGLPAEAGEFTEIVKKIQFQGKPLDDASVLHMKKELGDLLFYAMMACTALGVTGDEVIAMNKDKLDKRFVEGFTVDESENRAEGDL